MFRFYTNLLPFKIDHAIKALEIAEISSDKYKIEKTTLMLSDDVSIKERRIFQYAYKSLTDEFVLQLEEAGIEIPELNHSYLSIGMDANFITFLQTKRMPDEVIAFYEERENYAHEIE